MAGDFVVFSFYILLWTFPLSGAKVGCGNL